MSKKQLLKLNNVEKTIVKTTLFINNNMASMFLGFYFKDFVKFNLGA